MAAPDRRLSAFVILYGVLVGSGGVLGYVSKGSIPSLAAGGGLGLLLVAAGVGMLRRSTFAARAAQWLVLAVVAVMAERLISSGGVIPAVPVIATGLALS